MLVEALSGELYNEQWLVETLGIHRIYQVNSIVISDWQDDAPPYVLDWLGGLVARRS